MTIHIEELTLSSIIGILDFERIKKQTIIIDIQLDYYYQENHFINYANVIQLVTNLIQTQHYLLLEDALNDIQSKLLLKYPAIIILQLKISKPDIIKNAMVGLSLKWSAKN
jgi:dihydroneopterin aldolase